MPKFFKLENQFYMINNLEQNEKIETLTLEIERLKAEIAHEKALKEALEDEYQLLNYQFEEAVKYIKMLKKAQTGKGYGSLLIFILLLALLFLFFMLANSNASVIPS